MQQLIVPLISVFCTALVQDTKTQPKDVRNIDLGLIVTILRSSLEK